MRKPLAALAACAVLTGLVPIASAALSPSPGARVTDDLAGALASAPASEKLLVLVHGTTRAAALDAVDGAGLLPVGELRSIGVPVAVGTIAQVRDLLDEPGVTFVERDEPLQPALESSRTAIGADVVQSPPAGTRAFTGAGQTIAVVDTGVDGTHPMFAGRDGSRVVRNLKVVCLDNVPGFTAYALVGADPATCPAAYTGYPDEADTNEPFIVDLTSQNDTDSPSLGGHGTHVAGIAAGGAVKTADGHALSGIAPGASVVSLSMGASLTIYGANAALDWIARHHADPCGDGSCASITVVNNSYGSGGTFDPASATAKITAKLLAEGVTMVWANGNGDVQGDGGDGTVNRTAREAANPAPGVISVANYDDAESGSRDGTIDDSSSRGDETKPKTWPDLAAPGTDITSACRVHLTVCMGAVSADPNYGTISGTSMAAPHVAGAVAVLQEASVATSGARLSPAALEDILEDTAHKFSFGAPYAADPSNPDNTSSFDKGHGLLDLAAAVARVTGTPTVSASGAAATACTPGAPLATDPKGDATMVAVADSGSNEATLDVVGADVAGDPSRERMVLTISVADLTAADASGTTGTRFDASLTIGATAYAITAERTSSGSVFFVDGTEVSGRFDARANQVRVAIPRATIGNPSGVVTVTTLTDGYSRRRYAPTPLGPVADRFSGGCARAVEVGGAPKPLPVVVPGSPYEWRGQPTTAVSDPVGAGASVTAEGTFEDVRRVEVRAGSVVVFEVSCASAVDDFDIRLTGPDGKPAGTGTAPGESANGGCIEKIVVRGAPAGVYTATVVAFATVGGTYEARVRSK